MASSYLSHLCEWSPPTSQLLRSTLRQPWCPFVSHLIPIHLVTITSETHPWTEQLFLLSADITVPQSAIPSQAGCSNNSYITLITLITLHCSYSETLLKAGDGTFLGQTVQWLPLPLTINLRSDSLPWSLKALHIGDSCPQPRLDHGIPWGSIYKMPVPGPHPRPIKPQSLGVGPRCRKCFQFLRWF